MTHSSSISDTVMRRVYRVHALRRGAAVIGAASVFMLALWGVGREVWVAKVFENMPSVADVPAVALFFLRAFQDTDIVVQTLVIVALAALIWFARAFARVAVVRPSFA